MHLYEGEQEGNLALDDGEESILSTNSPETKTFLLKLLLQQVSKETNVRSLLLHSFSHSSR